MMEIMDDTDKSTKEKLLANLIDKLLSMGDESAEAAVPGEEKPDAEISAVSIEADPEVKDKLGL